MREAIFKVFLRNGLWVIFSIGINCCSSTDLSYYLPLCFGGREWHVRLVSSNILAFHLSFSRAVIIRCWRQHVIWEKVTFCLKQIHKCLQFCCRAEVECNHMCHKNNSFHSQTREIFKLRLYLSIFVKKLGLMYRELQNENHYTVSVRIRMRMRLRSLHVDISIYSARVLNIRGGGWGGIFTWGPYLRQVKWSIF